MNKLLKLLGIYKLYAFEITEDPKSVKGGFIYTGKIRAYTQYFFGIRLYTKHK